MIDGKGRYPVLQQGQFVGNVRRQQIAPGGEHLPELHEDRAERFEGLAQAHGARVGEASPEEFATFIGPDIKLDPVTMAHLHNIDELLTFYMGKNTPDRQEFIIKNLRYEISAA